MTEKQDEQKEQKIDDGSVASPAASDQAKKTKDKAQTQAKPEEAEDQTKAKTDTETLQDGKKSDSGSESSDKVSLKTEEKKEGKKKARKPKPKADIRVQQVGHRSKIIDTDETRGRKIEVIGHVISDKMDKTITVQIYRKVRHPRVGKYIKRSTKFKAHDEKNAARVGDQVLIHASRALSKTKYWKLSKILKSSERL